jgi:hypothetical protein
MVTDLRMNKFVASIVFLLCCNPFFAKQRQIIDLSQADWTITLDRSAAWKADRLYLPPVDLASLPENAPTEGWEKIFASPDTSGVHLPATVEEYFWGWNGQTFGVTGNYTGVSWFATKVFIPENWKGKRIVINTESVRFRAEIYVNRHLAGYDIVNGTPFEFDITEMLNTGKENEIVYRITDPNGNFNWKDSQIYKWGIYDTNPSHGFGGITGKVVLTATEKLYIDNVFIKNRPNPSEIEVEVTVANNSGIIAENKKIKLEIFENHSGNRIYVKESVIDEILNDKKILGYQISLKNVKLWSVDEPNLYTMTVSLADDQVSERFGFRWFEVKDVAGDKHFFLNGKRIVLRSAISWGYWPDNGIAPTDEYALKQIRVAKALGQNMLSFHRAIGQTNVINFADELGLLIWEEPGGNQYSANKFNDNSLQSNFYFAYRNEKLARMIKRDRNHPSLIIYNLHNERGAEPQAEDMRQMQMAHRIDPSRQINYNSSNGENPEGIASARFKLHLKPYDTTFYDIGWYDRHHAGGPGVYHDQLYQNPANYLRFTDNRSEIVYWGEEGAIGTPPRLELIRKSILKTGKTKGWEAADYLGWYDAFDRFLTDNGFRKAFPTVDALTLAMGNVAYYYQGRIIENIRINNTNDGYAVNGWEAMKLENHSGIVDNYRNPKGDTSLIARYNRPLHLAVKTDRKVLSVGDTATIDVFMVNEKNLKGAYSLTVKALDSNGKTYSKIIKQVTLKGGNEYGQLLFSGIKVPVLSEGYSTVEATLETASKNKITVIDGNETLFAVQLDKSGIDGKGLIADTSGVFKTYLSSEGINLREYRYGAPDGDYLLVGDFEPQQWGSGMSDIIEWVQKGGSLVIVGNPVRWAEFLADKEILDFRGAKELGRSWYGGNFFNRSHPIFKGLPSDCVFNWEYQCFAAYDRRRIGLRTANGETLVACVSDHKKEVYSALSLIPVGRGKIYITTLDIQACIAGSHSHFAQDADGMNEAMNTFNRVAENRANVVGKQLLLNLLRDATSSETATHRDLYLNSDLPDSAVDNKLTFNTFQEAAKHFTDGVTLNIAPGVYWIDDPDDPEVRTVKDGQRAPFGMVIRCNNLTLRGLSDDPQDVVLACNRGQSLGSKGNFTMFSFIGDDLTVENLTMGNYCNVDLEYPLNPALNRAKRSSTIVQAQLAFVDGDRLLARNCRFISRLNTCNLIGARRALFDRCHIECTDDALATGVYLNCSFGFYSSKPFGNTRGTGSVMLNCDFEVRQGERQYFTKVQGAVTAVDCRYHSASDALYIGWNQEPTDDYRAFQSNITHNGKPVVINADKRFTTVDITGKPLLKAYRFEFEDKTVYNTWNLLKGADDWDPMNIRHIVEQAEKSLGEQLSDIPTFITVIPPKTEIESGVTKAELTANILNFDGSKPSKQDTYKWSVISGNRSLLRLENLENSTLVSGLNTGEDPEKIIVSLTTDQGLEAASVLTVAPKTLDAPQFSSNPKIVENERGKISVNFTLIPEERSDESKITWYRSKSASGNDAIPIAVSRNPKKPEYGYQLSQNDIGYFIAAEVVPKVKGSAEGDKKMVITSQPIEAKDVIERNISTDFNNFPVDFQPEIKSGFYTLDIYNPVDNQDYEWDKNRRSADAAWTYGHGYDGARDKMGLIPLAKGSRMLFTPIDREYGDMKIKLKANPCKTAAQGFGMAGQFLDVFIKLDTRTMSGYALRLIRTVKSARAVDFLLIKYENGKVTPISDAITSTAFRTECTVVLEVRGNILTAHAGTDAKQDGDYPDKVDLSATVEPSNFGGLGLFFTSSGGSNSTVFSELEAEWN